MNSAEVRIMALTSVAHFFTHVFMLIYPTIAVIIAVEWATAESDMLLLATPGFMLYGLVAFPQGLLADRVGGFVPVLVGLIGMGGGSILCGVAKEPWALAAGLGVIGLFASAYHPAGLGLISQGMSRPGWALGINGAIGSAAVAVAPGLAEILSSSVGWRGTFTILGSVAIFVGVVLAFFPVRPEPAVAHHEVSSDEPLFQRSFILLCIVMLFSGLAYRGVNIILPTLFSERIDGVGHGVATSMTYGFAVVMNYFGGRLADRYAAPRLYFVFHAFSFAPLVLTAWLSGPELLTVAAGYAAGAMAAQPVENRYIALLSPASRRSVAYGIKFTISFGVGALAVPAVSAILEHFGTRLVMLVLSAVVGCLVVSAWVLLRHSLRTSNQHCASNNGAKI